MHAGHVDLSGQLSSEVYRGTQGSSRKDRYLLLTWQAQGIASLSWGSGATVPSRPQGHSIDGMMWDAPGRAGAWD